MWKIGVEFILALEITAPMAIFERDIREGFIPIRPALVAEGGESRGRRPARMEGTQGRISNVKRRDCIYTLSP